MEIVLVNVSPVNIFIKGVYDREQSRCDLPNGFSY